MRRKLWRKLIDTPVQFLVLMGALGFFGSMLSSSDGLDLLKSIAWPIESSNGALIHSSGNYIVPHWSVGRIQIYDQDKNFIRWWNVQAAGGSFKLAPHNEESFYVYTARGNQQLEYDIQGKLISSEEYTKGYPDDSDQLVSFYKHVPIYLKPFTDSMLSGYLLFFGMLIQYFTQQLDSWISNRFKKKQL